MKSSLKVSHHLVSELVSLFDHILYFTYFFSIFLIFVSFCSYTSYILLFKLLYLWTFSTYNKFSSLLRPKYKKKNKKRSNKKTKTEKKTKRKLKKKNIESESDEFRTDKCNIGISYEKDVVEYINNNIHPVVSVDGKINQENCIKTINLMKVKTPFIHSAKFCNDKDSGEIDLLVLNTHINLLNDNIVVDEKCNPYYIVIEIKYMKISKVKNSLLIKNTQNIKIAKNVS